MTVSAHFDGKVIVSVSLPGHRVAHRYDSVREQDRDDRSRADKDWSLTDCLSFIVIERR
jgi:hypothetical protein